MSAVQYGPYSNLQFQFLRFGQIKKTKNNFSWDDLYHFHKSDKKP